MRSTTTWLVCLGAIVIPVLVRAADPPPPNGPPEVPPIREIFVPFEDLDALLEGDTQRVFLGRQEYEALLAKAAEQPATETPRDWLMLAADYEVTIADGRATIAATLDLEVFTPGLFAVPLPLQDVGIRAAALDDGAAPLARDDQGGLTVFVEGQGRHRLALDLVAALQTTAAQQSLTFELPSPPSRRMQLTVPGNVELKSGAAVSRRAVDADQGLTRFELVPPRGRLELAMSLNNRTLLQQRVVMARSVMVDEVTQAYERLHATFSLGVLHGAVEQFRFRIPDGFEVSDVSSPLLSRWEVAAAPEANAARTLEVTLREPTTETVVLNLSATGPASGREAWSMPRFEPLDVNNHVAVVGLLLEDRLAVETIDADGLIPIDNRVLERRLPASVFEAEPGAPRVRSVVVYYAPQAAFELTARFRRPPARTQVNAHVLLLLNERQQIVRGGVTVEPEAEKVFTVDLGVPAGWTVTKVATREGAELPRERFELPGGGTRLHVRLPQGIALGERFELLFDANATPAGWLDEWSEREVEFPVFTVIGAARDEGAIAVQTADDLIARPLDVTGLTPLDEAEKTTFGLAGAPTSLAYQYVTQPYAATIHLQRGRPRLTAQTYAFLGITPDGLAAHYEVAYDVRHAATRRLVFDLPETTPAALSIRGLDGVRVKEYNSEIIDGRRRWTVLLADGQAGVVRLAVDFSQQLPADEPSGWELPMVRAGQVSYQTAMVAVEGSAEFDIELQTEGRAIDVGELVGAEYQVGRRLLGAFGFIGREAQVAANVVRRPAYGLPTAIVQRVELVTLVSASGRSQTAARYEMRTKATYLQVDLPDPQRTQLWSATLDGVPATPQRDGTGLLISLPPKADHTTRNLQFVYESTGSPFSLMGNVEIAAPRLFIRGDVDAVKYEVPVADLTWDLVLPTGHQVLRAEGSVQRHQSPRMSPLAVAAGALWKLSGGFRAGPFQLARQARPVGSAATPHARYGIGADTATDELRLSEEFAETESMDRPLAMPMEAAGEAVGQAADSTAPAEPAPASATTAPATSPAPVVVPPVTEAASGAEGLEATDGEPASREYWALEGVRSLQIDLHERGERVSFHSMGAAPVLRASLVDGNRLKFLGYALAILVAVVGIGLTRRPPRRKVRFLIESSLAALLLPPVIGWVTDLDLGATFDGPFYATCLVAVYYLAVAACSKIVRAFSAVGSIRRRPGGSPPQSATGPSSSGSAASTVSVLLLIAAVSTLASAAWPAAALAQPAPPPGRVLTPEGLADLLQPGPPLQLPPEAVIIPYDADDADGLQNAERVLVPLDEYTRLWKRAFPDQPLDQQPPPAAYALAGGAYAAVLADDDQLTISGHIDLDVYVDEPVAVPLPLRRAVLAAATLDNQTARIQVITAQPPVPQAANQQAEAQQQAKVAPPPEAESFVLVHLQGRGRHRLALSVRLHLTRSGGWRQVDGVIPVAPATRLALTIPAAETEVRLAGVADQQTFETQRDDQPFITALGAGGAVQLQWRPKVGAGDVDQSLTVQSTALFDIQEDGLRMAWQFDLQFRTQRATFTIQLPAEYLLEKVLGDNVRGWTVKPAGDGQQLDVNLLKATTGSETMTLLFSRREAVGQGDLASFTVPLATVPDAVLHQGHVAIRRSPLLAVETREAIGVSRTDPTESSRAVMAAVEEESPLGIRPFQDFRFVTTPFTIGLAAAPLADPATTPRSEQTAATLQTLVRVGARETGYESRVTVHVKQRPVHRLRVLLPAEFQLDRVDAPGVFEQSTQDQAGRPLLSIYLSEGQREEFSILVSGHVRRAADASDVGLPKIEVLDVGEQQGHVAIQADPAYQVRLLELANCRTVPLSRVATWLHSEQRSHTGLAVAYTSRDYGATLRTTAVTPEVEASTISNVRVTTREIEETVLLRFAIKNAGVRSVTFGLPARLRDARITVPMLRQTTIQDVADDPDRIQVTLELQDDKMGELIVLVENDVALRDAEHSAPIPLLESVENLQRYVVLENAGRDEVVVRDTAGMQALRRDQTKWATLSQVLDNKITQAFIVADDAQQNLTFALRRREVVETAGAAIRLAQATLVVDGNGTYRGLQEYRVDNKTEQYLEIELPPGAQLWTVRVAGEPVKPTEVPAANGGQVDLRQLRIPLIKTAAGDLDYPVEIKYGGLLGTLSTLRRIEFPLVKTKRIKVELSHVRLHLPDSHQFFRFDGTMKRVREEAELAAGFLAYRNRQIEQLRHVISGKRGVFSKIRAANNLKQLGLAMNNYAQTYESFNRNDQFQAELRNNSLVLSEANRQLATQEKEISSAVAPDNRAKLFSAYASQRSSRASNIVNNLNSNFFRADVELGTKAVADDNEAPGGFNSRWLDKNHFAVQDDEKQDAKQLDRITAGSGKGPAKKAEAKAAKALDALPQQLPRFRIEAEGESRSAFGRARRSERGEQIERYQQQLAEQTRSPQADGAQQFEQPNQGAEGRPGQSRGQQPLLGSRSRRLGVGDGFGGGGGAFGGVAGMGDQQRPPTGPVDQLADQVSPSRAAGMMGMPLSDPRAATGGRAISQPPVAYSGRTQAGVNLNASGFVVATNGLAGPTSGLSDGDSGFASLDVELPVRGKLFLFTTPRGDTQITVQAVPKKQLWRCAQFGIAVAVLFVLWAAGWCFSRVLAHLGQRTQATLLILLGIASLVIGILPVIGLLALLWGSGKLAMSFLAVHEEPRAA